MAPLTPIDIRLSPSRVEKFLECPARWGFAELEGNPEPGSEATELGTMVHALREAYYVHGTPFALETRAGWIAAAMSPALPRVLPPGGVTEHELGYAVTHAGRTFTLNGRLDLGYLGAGNDGQALAIVRDYKTTSSMGYAKLEREALLGHSQAPLYGLMYMQALGVQQAWLGWVYVGTRTSLGLPPWPAPELACSDHLISYAEAEERVHLRMVPAAAAMLELRDAFAAGTPVDAFPKNTTACFKYNKRCPFWARCLPEKRKAMSSLFLAAVGAKVAPQPAPPAPATPPAAPPAPAPEPEPQTPPAGATQGAATGSIAAPPAAPAINPPEEPGAPTTKTKTKAPAVVRLAPEDIQAVAAAIVQQLGLALVRNPEMPRG